MKITVPVTITLDGALAPNENGVIPGSEKWLGGPWNAAEFALTHLVVGLHWPRDWMHGCASVEVGEPTSRHEPE